MILTVLVNNDKKSIEKEMIQFEKYIGKLTDFKVINEENYLNKKDEFLEIDFEFDPYIEEMKYGYVENYFIIKSIDYEIYINYDKETHEYDVKTWRIGYEPTDIYEDEIKNRKTIKTSRGLIGYIKKFHEL